MYNATGVLSASIFTVIKEITFIVHIIVLFQNPSQTQQLETVDYSQAVSEFGVLFK